MTDAHAAAVAPGTPRLRDAAPADFASILALNQQSVAVLSALTAARLAALHAAAAWHRVVEVEGAVAAFLLVLREGCDYDSVNYRWFAQRYTRFLYVDRVVVAAACRGQGLGERLYADLFAFAARDGAERITCEFDLEPPNPASARFHRRFGFEAVGTQWLAGGKRVSLQALALPRPAPRAVAGQPPVRG